MIYKVVDEASTEVVSIMDNLDEAKIDATSRKGKFLVVDNYGEILFDSFPSVSYKI